MVRVVRRGPFQPFGLGVPLEEDVGRSIFELHHVRNLFAHRRGIVDRRFVQSCPWLDLTLGDHFVIDHDRFIGYLRAIDGYVASLITRMATVYTEARETRDEEPD